MKESVTCLYCKEIFVSYKSNNRKFCSKKCAGLHNGKKKSESAEKITISCENCNKPFTLFLSTYKQRSKTSIPKYCGMECQFMRAKGKRKLCKYCGKMFRPVRSSVKFCSKDCSDKNRKGTPIGNGKWASLGRKEYMKQYLKEYTQKNKEKHNDRHKKWVKNNQEKRRQSALKWQKNNKDKVTASANRRRAAKLQATPAWSNEIAVNHFYMIAKMLEEQIGRKVHVDHIIPLKSNLVCGLHCEHNLRLMFAEDNLKKGQAFDLNDARFTKMTHGFTQQEAS